MKKTSIGEGLRFQLAEAFQAAGWQVRSNSSADARQSAMVVRSGARRFAVNVKAASEGRGDRLIPLLAQSILEAQAFARQSAEVLAPLAVVAARRVPASVVEQIEQFVGANAPGVAFGVMDAEGLRSFAGPGLENLNANPRRARVGAPKHQTDLFSDLNQWMLKILLGQKLPARLISIPRGPLRNASQLAAAASVSVMSASRLVNQLLEGGFLSRDGELRIVRSDELLERWISASRKPPREIAARWIVKKDQQQLWTNLKRYAGAEPAGLSRPRIALALFAAADALGLGFVRGVTPHIYLERLDSAVLKELGLTVEDADRRADFFIRVPQHPEAVFRASAWQEGLPISDILQVWLDVAAHPARGTEQAEEIRRRALKSVFERSS